MKNRANLPAALLPNWVPRFDLNRPTAQEIQRAENRQQTLTYAGFNSPIPIVYGEQIVAGPIIAGPTAPPGGSGTVVAAIALCYGGQQGIERVLDVRSGGAVASIGSFGGDPNSPATGNISVNGGTVSVRCYSGRQTAVDAQLATHIAGFTDVFEGIAYAVLVFNAGASAVQAWPQLSFRVRGRKPLAIDAIKPWSTLNIGFAGDSLLAMGQSNNGNFVAAGENGKLANSPDLSTWTARASTFGASDIRTVSDVLGVNIAIGGDGGNLASSGGAGNVWTARDAGFGTYDVRHVSHGLAVGDGGNVSYSANNLAWAAVGNKPWNGIGYRIPGSPPSSSSAQARYAGNGDLIVSRVSSNIAYLERYTRSGDTYTLARSVSGFGPTTTSGMILAVSRNGEYVATARTVTATDYVWLFRDTGSAFVALTYDTIGVSARVYSLALNSDGTILVIGLNVYPWIVAYQRTGNHFTKLTTPPFIGSWAVNSLNFSPSGAQLAVGTAGTGVNNGFVYDISGTTFTRTNITSFPGGLVRWAEYNQAGTLLAFAKAGEVVVCSVSGSTVTIIKTITLAGTNWAVSFSSDDRYLCISINAAPYLVLYDLLNDEWVSGTFENPPTRIQHAQFSPVVNHLATNQGTFKLEESFAVLNAATFVGPATTARRFYIAGDDGVMYQSSSNDPATADWNEITAGFGAANILFFFRFGPDDAGISSGAPLFAFADDGQIRKTENGTVWVDDTMGLPGTVLSLREYAGTYYALLDDGNIYTSPGPTDWRLLTVAPMPFVPKRLFVYDGRLIIADDSGGVAACLFPDLAGQWTENPALHLYDFVTNDEFGPGLDVVGIDAAVSVCDSMYKGLPRARSGLTIQDARPLAEHIALLAEYAEVLWAFDGRAVRVVPDIPAGAVHTVPRSEVRDGSVNMTAVEQSQIPTLVQLTFTDRDSASEWVSRPAVSQMPAHTLHGVPLQVSTLPLPGIFNRLEAERRAFQRLMRMQMPGRVAWQMFSPGMAYEVGDVVRLPTRGAGGVDVRLTSAPDLVAPGLWQMGGEIYQASNYPDGGTGVAIPAGAIMIYRGTGAIPTGFAAYNISDRLIREGEPGNAGAVGSFTYTRTTGAGGAHRGPRSTGTGRKALISVGGTGVFAYMSGTTESAEKENHNHSFTITASALQALPVRTVRWVRKVSPGLMSPGIAFLAGGIISDQGVAPSSGLTGGYLAGGAAESTRNATTSASVGTTERPSHEHADGPNAVSGRVVLADGADVVTVFAPGANGAHSHTISATFSAKLRSIALAVYESIDDATMPLGGIVGWDGGAPPVGWALCDGANGTVNLTDRFIYISAPESAGSEVHADSEFTITFGNTNVMGAHQHGRFLNVRNPTPAIARESYHTTTEGAHGHAGPAPVTESLDNIIRYQLRFIQYTG